MIKKVFQAGNFVLSILDGVGAGMLTKRILTNLALQCDEEVITDVWVNRGISAATTSVAWFAGQASYEIGNQTIETVEAFYKGLNGLSEELKESIEEQLKGENNVPETATEEN